MTCNVIATGSKGNAVLLYDSILVDCGVPFTKLSNYLNGLQIVLLTHHHADHFNISTIKKIARLRPALRFAAPSWMAEMLRKVGIYNIDEARDGEWLDYGFMRIMQQSIPHDVQNCAWHIVKGTEKIIYATDCGSLDGVSAPNYSLYLIEANYVTQELEARQAAKLAAGKFSYESRAAASHLSKEQAQEWVESQAGVNSKVIYLHQHTGG